MIPVKKDAIGDKKGASKHLTNATSSQPASTAVEGDSSDGSSNPWIQAWGQTSYCKHGKALSGCGVPGTIACFQCYKESEDTFLASLQPWQRSFYELAKANGFPSAQDTQMGTADSRPSFRRNAS